jgi:hypothetical protein
MSTGNFLYLINPGMEQPVIRQKKCELRRGERGMHPSIRVEVILWPIVIRKVIFIFIETSNEEAGLIWERDRMFFRH